jgi:hypothetical protein
LLFNNFFARSNVFRKYRLRCILLFASVFKEEECWSLIL